jgi:hypothetical protein
MRPAITLATSNPSVNSDFLHGYRSGNFWINQSTDAVYQCINAMPNGAALWVQLSSGGGGGFVWMGPWSSSTNYVANDVVSYSNAAYIALQSNLNAEPDLNPLDWDVLVSGGISQAYADAHYRTKASYIWYQGVASTVWTIVHNLGTYPAVKILDSSGATNETDITYPDANTVISTSAYPFSGEAILT